MARDARSLRATCASGRAAPNRHSPTPTPTTRKEASEIPWFKVDDKLHDHRKARTAGKSAMGVWVLAGSWSADNLEDGFVPAEVLGRWGTRADAAKLVVSGLWLPAEKQGEEGWEFHGWEERQPTRAEVEKERQANADRLREWRRKRRETEGKRGA